MDGWMARFAGLLIQAGGQVYKRASSATSILLTFCPVHTYVYVCLYIRRRIAIGYLFAAIDQEKIISTGFSSFFYRIGDDGHQINCYASCHSEIDHPQVYRGEEEEKKKWKMSLGT